MKNKLIHNSLVDRNNRQIQIECIDIYKKLRKIWEIKPVTKIKKSKKKYNRQFNKKEVRKMLKGEDF